MSTTVLFVNELRDRLLYSVGGVCLALGTIGNLINILLFNKKSMRASSPCILLMLVASIANIVCIYTMIGIRILIGFKITPTFYSSAACKSQVYLYTSSFSISSWLMVGCCVDRFLSSSRNPIVRKYSNIRLAKRIMLFTTIFFLVLSGEVFYCYDANRLNAPAPCYATGNACAVVDSAIFFICQYAGPPALMFTLGLGTFFHIRQGSDRHFESIEMTNHHSTTRPDHRAHERKSGRTILQMLFGQVALYIIASLPMLALRIYLTATLLKSKSSERLVIENLILHMCVYCGLIDKIFGFYIYTLSSRHFRRECVKLFTSRCRTQQRVFPDSHT